MRELIIKLHEDKRYYIHQFTENSKVVWEVKSYVIVSHEAMVDWIEKGVHPVYKET